MPHSCFISRIRFSSMFIVLATAVAMNAQAADWHECEKAKVRQLQLQRSADSHQTARRKTQRREGDRRARAEEIETWLWKNCREYSYELRQIEQERM